MLKRKTIFAIGLSSLLAIAVMAPAVADQERGNRRGSGNSSQTTAPYLKTDYRQSNRGHNHRPHWKQYRHAHRNNHKYYRGRGHHRHFPVHRHGHDHRFATGLVFGGTLGYIIGNSY